MWYFLILVKNLNLVLWPLSTPTWSWISSAMNILIWGIGFWWESNPRLHKIAKFIFQTCCLTTRPQEPSPSHGKLFSIWFDSFQISLCLVLSYSFVYPHQNKPQSKILSEPTHMKTIEAIETFYLFNFYFSSMQWVQF